MSLFKTTDIKLTGSQPADIHKASGTHFYSPTAFASSKSMNALRETFQNLQEGGSCYYITDGAWSNIELLEYLLAKTGPANVYFTTWSISAEAITRFGIWHDELAIIDLWAVLDTGLNNRKPADYQLATGTFKYLRTCKCHAKVTVIENADHHLVIMGSANYTKNPRKEAGIVIWDKGLADYNIKWILEEFADV
jgi:hypothetical protein